MMDTLNRVTLIGRLGRDPQRRRLRDGRMAADISLATSETLRDARGEKVEVTEWHRITFTGPLAEAALEHLKKGGSACIEGKVRSARYLDRDGTERRTVVIDGTALMPLTPLPEERYPDPAREAREAWEAKKEEAVRKAEAAYIKRARLWAPRHL